MSKKTPIGKKILENSDNFSVDIREVREAMTSNYMKKLLEAVDEGKKTFDGDFFVHVLTKIDRITRAVTTYFHPRVTYPIPNSDQTLYKFYRDREDLVLLWVLPTKDTIDFLVRKNYKTNGREQEFAKFVYNYMSGRYLDDAIDYNRKIEGDLNGK